MIDLLENLHDCAERELQEEEDRACDVLCIVRMLARKMNEALEKAIPIIIVYFRESHKFNELQKKYDKLWGKYHRLPNDIVMNF